MSSYVRKTLSEGEEVIADATFHWMRFFWPVLGVICGLAVLWLNCENREINDFYLSILVAVITLYSYYKILDYMSYEATLTNQRIVAHRGLLHRRILDLQLSEVEMVAADLPILKSRIFNTGTLVITGTGGSRLAVPWIRKVLEFRKIIQDTLNESRAQKPVTQDKSPIQLIPQNNNSNDKIELLYKLKGLLDGGVLSQEEFQAEKERIMNNT